MGKYNLRLSLRPAPSPKTSSCPIQRTGDAAAELAPSPPRPAPAAFNNPKADIVVAGKNTDTLALTEGLAADAAGILERDYGIDAGEVLSMNVDTVETSEDTSEVTADDAASILGDPQNGVEATWSSYNFPFSTSSASGYGHSGREGFKSIPTKNDTISSNWSIASKSLDDGTEESVVLYTKRGESFEFLKNTAEWQTSNQNDDEGKFIEATYKTTMGGDPALLTKIQTGTDADGNPIYGSENYDACGEAWWFFKLNEDNTEGYAVVIDNHGHYGCGIFTRYWYQMYVVHYDFNNPLSEEDIQRIYADDLKEGGDMAENVHTEKGIPKSPASKLPWSDSPVNVEILQKWRVSPLQIAPRYDVTVHEKDGKATITVDPDEANAPYSYIGGEPYTYQGYYMGYPKGADNSNIENSNAALGVDQNGYNYLDGNGYSAEALYFYQNKDDYDWAWPGSTQGAVTCEIDLSDSILSQKTTQAFSCYRWCGTYFANNSVNVMMQKTKAFSDIVYEPSWTDGALHMLINMDTLSDSTMLGKDNGTESSTRLLDKDEI